MHECGAAGIKNKPLGEHDNCPVQKMPLSSIQKAECRDASKCKGKKATYARLSTVHASLKYQSNID